jgi:hypothetical protein
MMMLSVGASFHLSSRCDPRPLLHLHAPSDEAIMLSLASLHLSHAHEKSQHNAHLASRRASLLGGAAAALALATPSVSAADVCPDDDRCATSVLLSSNRVPPRLREALRLATDLFDGWNDLTSECTGDVCKVSEKRVLEVHLTEEAPLMTLATDGALRDPLILALVAPADRQAYARNRERFESSMRYVAMSASLARYDPALPRFAKGSYVPKGLKDEGGRLLGSSLENARDFLLDAKDALTVCCSFIHCASKERTAPPVLGSAAL